MNPIELLEKHCEFNTDYDCYVLLAVSRKKDTPEITNSQEIVFREIVRHKGDITRKYNKIKNQCQNYKDDNGKTFPFYIYISLNGRDALTAFYKFQHLMLDWNEELNKSLDARDSTRIHERIKRTDRHFLSVLMKPECRVKNKYFMIDFDEKETVDEFRLWITQNEIEIVIEQETKNGYHFKVKPFDRRKIDNIKMIYDCEVKTDAQIFIEYIKDTKYL